MGVTSNPVKDPWQIAFDNLDPDLKVSLISVKSDRFIVLSEVLNEAEKKRKLCLEKRWKIQIHGKVIILRDVFDKIILWINKFKEIGDIAVQVNPDSAALPWAGVRFLLQAAVSDIHCFESTIQGVESVTRLIVRYAAFEALYTTTKSAVDAQLQDRLACLYSQVLIFLANGIKYFNRSGASRMIKAVFQTAQNEELKTISELDEEVEKLARLVDSQIQQNTHSDVETIRAILESFENPILRLIDVSNIYTKTLQEQQFHTFLKWLSPVPYSQHHDRHSENRLPGTATWLLQHAEYLSWKSSSSSSLLLLHGIPGCGKTSLVSAVVDSFLDEKRKNALAAPLAYFYCGDSKIGRGRADTDEILRSITRQLATIDREKYKLHEQAVLEYERREAEAKLDGFEVPRLRSTECADMILNVLGANPATIVIDGVDEVDKSKRHELLNALVRVRDESASVIKIFLSSRNDTNIFAHLPDAILLHIQEAEARQDMDSYIRHSVLSAIENQSLLDGNVPADLQEELVKFLSDRAGEMFLWVNLQMERFCERRSKAGLCEVMRACANTITPTINQLYSEMLNHIENTDPHAYEIAIKAFSWLLCMHEPLSPEAFIAAVSATDLDAGVGLTLPELLTTCSNLIVLDTRLDTLRFAHLSVKEFLEERQDFEITRVNCVAAISCLETCINGSPIDIGIILCPHQEFELYASMYWASHYESTASTAIWQGDVLELKLKEFVFCDDGETSLPFIAWLETTQEVSDRLANDHPLKKRLKAVISSTMTPFFTACIYGLDEILRIVLGLPNFGIDMQNFDEHTGLYLAAACGHDESVSLLLQFGADANVKCGKHGSALHAAAAQGYVVVVQILLSNGSQSRSSDEIKSVFHTSLLAGQENVSLFVLDNGLEISCQGDYDRILDDVVQTGSSEVAQRLMKTFPSYSKAGRPSSRAIESAISKGQLSFIQNYMKKSLVPGHSVATAALFGQTAIAVFCLDQGFDIEKEGPFGTPLRAASLMGHESTTRMLLERGAKTNASGAFGDALQVAAMKGHLSIVDLLIKYKADINSNGGYYGTALQAAAYRGHRDVAEVLINSGAFISQKGRYKDAFHAAVEAGQESTMALLLDKGYDLGNVGREPPRMRMYERQRCDQRSLLRQASPSRMIHRGTYGKRTEEKEPKPGFLSHGYDFEDVFSSTRETHHSNNSKADSLSQAQRNQGARTSEESNENMALEIAASRGNETMVHFMTENTRKAGLQASQFGHALWAACEIGHVGIVEHLTSSDVDLRCYIQGSLEQASLHGHTDVLEILLKYQDLWGVANRVAQKGHPKGRLYPEANLEHGNPFANKAVIPIVKFGCRGNQLSSVKRGLQLVGDAENSKLECILLEEAAIFDRSALLESLYQDGHIFQSAAFCRAFELAAEDGSKSVLEFLVKRDRNNYISGANYGTAFRHAARNGRIEMVRYLVKKGVENCTPAQLELMMLMATKREDLEILKLLFVEILLHKKCDIPMNQALKVACIVGNSDIAKLLIIWGADVNAFVGKDRRLFGHGARGLTTALQTAVHEIPGREPSGRYTGRYSMIDRKAETDIVVSKQETLMKLLLNNGADVNLATDSMAPPLYSAALKCTEDMVRRLIEHGAHIDKSIPEIGTPLECAARREIGSLPIVRALLEAGAHIPVEQTEDGVSSLILKAALTNFAVDRLEEEEEDNDDDRFAESETLEDVMTRGPGAVIKLLLETKPELQAKDSRFGLLLQMAIAMGDEDYVRLLIERNVDVNSPGHYYGSALHTAARFGHLNLVDLLLRAGADANMTQGSLGTPLQAAVKGEHFEVVCTLLRARASLNQALETSNGAPSDRGKELGSALQLAIDSKNLLITKLLVGSGAEIDELPVLHKAVKSGDLDIVQVLLDAQVDVNRKFDGHSPVLITACGHGNAQIVELLLSHGANVDEDGNESHSSEASALHKACAKGRSDIVRMLLENGADVDKRVKGCLTPLAVAAKSNHLEIMKQLLEAGATIYDPPRVPNVLEGASHGTNSRNRIQLLVMALSDSPNLIPACQEALRVTQMYNDEESFLLLLGKVPKTPELLPLACTLSSKNAVGIVLSHGADVNCEFEDGGRALHEAAFHQNVPLVQLLIDKGADVRCVSSRFGTAIRATLEGLLSSTLPMFSNSVEDRSLRDMVPSISTSQSGNFKFRDLPRDKKEALCELILRLLLDSGADANADPRPNLELLHIAAYIGSLSLIHTLLENGADINISGGYFGSALIAATCGDHIAVIKKLLARGIDPNITSPGFGTALQYACKHKSPMMIQVLLDHGADVNAIGAKEESPLTALLAITTSIDPRDKDEMVEDKIDVLLRHGDRLQIRTEDLILAVRSRRPHLREIIKRLLKDSNLRVTEDVITAAAANPDPESPSTLAMLLDHANDPRSTSEIMKAYGKRAMWSDSSSDCS